MLNEENEDAVVKCLKFDEIGRGDDKFRNYQSASEKL